MAKMGPPGRGQGRAPAVYWVSGELEAAEVLTAAGFLISHSHGADPRIRSHTQATRTRKGSHMPRASCYLRAPDDSLMHAHRRRHDCVAQELPGGGRAGSRHGPTCLAEATCAKAAVGAVCGGTDLGKGGSRRPAECLRMANCPSRSKMREKAGRASEGGI